MKSRRREGARSTGSLVLSMAVERRYHEQQFRSQVREDGEDVEPQVHGGGDDSAISEDHGLPVMHEPASLTGDKVSVWSAPNSGREKGRVDPCHEQRHQRD